MFYLTPGLKGTSMYEGLNSGTHVCVSVGGMGVCECALLLRRVGIWDHPHRQNMFVLQGIKRFFIKECPAQLPSKTLK